MREESKKERQAEIEAAAYEVLEERGYAGTSMLAIARKARASNETLYNWYGDKTGLFAALVRGNASAGRAYLETRIASGGDALETLERFGPDLLKMLSGERAVALNRAAAADPTGSLGAALAKEGREGVAPLVMQVMDLARTQGVLQCDDLGLLTETYLSLLIGDVQIRRATGQLAELSEDACRARSRRAIENLKTLFG